MSEEEARLQVFKDYLQGEFPDTRIETSREAGAGGGLWCLRINLPGGAYHSACVTNAFLADTPIDRIVPKVQTFLLVEHLRDMGSARVIVTNQGLATDF